MPKACLIIYLHITFGLSIQGGSSLGGLDLIGKQQLSSQSSSQPQSHCSLFSTTPLPQIDSCISKTEYLY